MSERDEIVGGEVCRLERCPDAKSGKCHDGLVQSGTHPGVYDAPCPTCRWELVPPGWVAVPVEADG
jgi:hypothetical protein